MDLTRVQRLPDDLVNKIAAGEVVERPASVVKELLENALDAGAGSVQVEVQGGGKTLIRVRDDGRGMAREDAVLALERHATSKLRALDDLQRIATHGFRGEALPSIASVGHLVLRTRDDSGPAGTEIEVEHGRPVHVRDTGHPRGTTVEVRDLFGGVPARRKFLRADATEAAHVADAVALLALAHPQVGFTLQSSGRTAIQAPPVDSLLARLHQIQGAALVDDLLEVEGGEGWVTVRGFVPRPQARAAAGRALLRLYVNGRAVRDRAVSRAVAEAYRAAGAGGLRGEAFLFLETPLHMVDVNVHPAKTEVRFAEPRTVWTGVERAVRSALSAGTRSQMARADTARIEAATERIHVATERFLDGTATVAEPRPVWPAAGAARASNAAASPLLEPDSAPLVLGQHRRTYILASDGEDLILVDQHTAHERIRYEALLEQVARRAAESQVLLLPMVETLPGALAELVEAHQADLQELGFDLEPFGAGSVRLRAVPAVLGPGDAARALRAILQELRESESSAQGRSARERLAASLACHSAVRAGEGLGLPAMAAIVRDLALTAHPSLCPHGRPTSVRIPKDEVSRWFGRTGWRRR